ncbi:hypothetical protein EYF80_015018 [Liparis tanakae]|uniref:Uncharacterized protein n=1 Tax=Liparis tanakae TaxID=230148 RepID=A0A4Z2IA00_9TELE|nr:hypothetical protein EYF80_015018 [Liparis tanakae]
MSHVLEGIEDRGQLRIHPLTIPQLLKQHTRERRWDASTTHGTQILGGRHPAAWLHGIIGCHGKCNRILKRRWFSEAEQNSEPQRGNGEETNVLRTRRGV